MNEIAGASDDRKAVVSVFLTCVSCGRVEEIHVFRERGLAGKVYWECISCQHEEMHAPSEQWRSAGCP